MPLEKFTLTLKWGKLLTPKVRHLAFTRADGQRLDFIPGQFITIYFPQDEKELRRSYSIASFAHENDIIEFSVGYFEGGPATHLLFNLEPGDTLTTTGPFGKLTLRDEHPDRYIFVATGTGITPYRSMIPQFEELLKSTPIKIIVLEGVKTRDDLLFSDDFVALAERYPNFEYRAQFSREALSNPKPFEHSGYVQNAFDDLQLQPEKDIVYLCGNPSMIDEAFEKLKALDFNNKNVRREKYISSN